MKFLLLLITLIGLFDCSSDQRNGVKIFGNVEQLPIGGFVYVERIGENGIEPFDTLNTNESGDFKEYLSIDEPAFYRVNFNGRQIITLILTGKEDEIEINAHGNDPTGFFEVSGSYDTEYKNQMDEIIQTYRQQIQEYQQSQRQAQVSSDANAFQTVQLQMMNLASDAEKDLKELIRKASPSLAAFYGLQMIDAPNNLTFVDSIATELKEEMPDNIHVTSLLSKINLKKTLDIGNEAPEISLQSPDGETIALSSLRGNYVLIDFWAAWCRPCRMENPNVVRIYNQYSDKNFEILGVSLDRTRDQWLQAIASDGLSWLHVSDLKYWGSKAARDYQINSIPATFLVDPDGKIIAKNLRGKDLEVRLKEIFG